MVELIRDGFRGSQNLGTDLDMASYVLRKMEDAGILPPEVLDKDRIARKSGYGSWRKYQLDTGASNSNINLHQWEPEDSLFTIEADESLKEGEFYWKTKDDMNEFYPDGNL